MKLFWINAPALLGEKKIDNIKTKETTDMLLDEKVQSHCFSSCEKIIENCEINDVIKRENDSIYITEHGAYPTSCEQHKIGDLFPNYGLGCAKEFDDPTQWRMKDGII